MSSPSRRLRGELLAAGEVGADQFERRVLHMGAKTLDLAILRRIAALAEWVPALLPSLFVDLRRATIEVDRPPRRRRAGQAVDGVADLPVGQLHPVRAELHHAEGRLLGDHPGPRRIIAGGFHHVHRKRVPENLLGRDRQRIEIRREAAFDQTEVAHIAEKGRHQLGRDRSGPLLMLGDVAVPRLQQQRFDAVDGQAFVRVQLRPGAFVEGGDERQFAQTERERAGGDAVDVALLHVVVFPRVGDFEIRLPHPRPLREGDGEEDAVVNPFELPETPGHMLAAVRELTVRAGQTRQHGGGVAGGGGPFEGVRVRRRQGERLVAVGFQIDKGTRQTFPHRPADRGDDRLAGVHRHERHPGVALRVVIVFVKAVAAAVAAAGKGEAAAGVGEVRPVPRFDLHHRGDRRQVSDSLFKSRFEAGRQRDGEAVEGVVQPPAAARHPGEQRLPHRHREVPAAVDHRVRGDLGREPEHARGGVLRVVGGRFRFAHAKIVPRGGGTVSDRGESPVTSGGACGDTGR